MYNETGVLEYNKVVYQNYYSSNLVSDFNHGPLTKGDIDISHVEKMIKQLNEIASQTTKNIFFDVKKIVKSLEGGSCSAIAFSIAKTALVLLRKLDMSSKNDRSQLVNKIAEAVKEINKSATNKKTKYSQSRKLIRSIQTAFNTITINHEIETKDVAQDKINALAGYYNVTVIESTEEIQVANNSLFEADLDKQLQKLSNGVHLLRIIHFENNHKLETQGHSVVYIKYNQELELCFDTQLGFYDLTLDESSEDKKHFLYHSLRSANERFHVDTCKFHKLEEVKQIEQKNIKE